MRLLAERHDQIVIDGRGIYWRRWSSQRVTKAPTINLPPDRSLHCVTAGEGADVVLIHGTLATSHDWIEGPFDALARKHSTPLS